jgi:hypothetical protein
MFVGEIGMMDVFRAVNTLRINMAVIGMPVIIVQEDQHRISDFIYGTAISSARDAIDLCQVTLLSTASP